jgi:hypothetical protein
MTFQSVRGELSSQCDTNSSEREDNDGPVVAQYLSLVVASLTELSSAIAAEHNPARMKVSRAAIR